MDETKSSLRKWLIGILVLALLLSLGYIVYRRSRIQTIPPVKVSPTAASKSLPDMPVTVVGIVQNTSRDSFSLKSGNATYNVSKTEKVAIIRRALEIPYILSEHTPEKVQKALITDIKKGMNVEVSGTIDKYNNLKAVIMVLPRITYVLEGTISMKGAGSFTMDGVPVLENTNFSPDGQPIPPEHAAYTIHITTDTEISSVADGTPKRYTLSELEPGVRVVVYANEDVTKSRDITAARVEPVLQ